MAKPRDTVVRFSCPSCGGNIKAPASEAGHQFTCPRCGARVVAPGRSGGEAKAISSDPAPPKDEVPEELPRLAPASSPDSERPEARPHAPGDSKKISVRCPLCGTAVEASEELIGQNIVCPDCESSIPVQRAAAPKRVSRTAPGADDDQLQLSAEEPSPFHILLPEELRKGESSSAPQPAITVRPARREYGIVCPLCGTRLYATEDRVGQEMKCPDCHKLFTIPPPPPSRPPSLDQEAAPSPGDEDDFRLSETFERPKWEPLVVGGIKRADLETAAVPNTGPVAEMIIACPSCGRRLYASSSQVGQKMVCVDCKAEVPVQPVASVAGQIKEGASRVTPPPPPARQPDRPSSDALERARRLTGDEEPRDRPLPKRPLVTGVLDFWKYPEAIFRWFSMALLVSLELLLILLAIGLSQSHNPVAQFGGVACSIAAALLGAMTAVTLSAFCLAILHDTAHGVDEIRSWPDWNFLDWIQESLYVIVPMTLSMTPGMIMVWILNAADAPMWLGLGFVVFSIWACYPFVQVSTLEADSIVLPISQPVWRSLGTCSKHWITFYAFSAILAVAGFLVLLLLFAQMFLLLLVVGMLLSVLIMLYYRLLGRLTWACQQEYSFDETDEEPEE